MTHTPKMTSPKTLKIQGLKTKAFAWLEDPALGKLMAFFPIRADGTDPLRIVGGAVRNGLQGLAVADIDLATDLRPDELLTLAKTNKIKAIDTGIEHGTVIFVIDQRAFEITSLRLDVETDGRHATIAYTNDWARDAARRDFTMNALYLSRDGVIYDYLGSGIEDASAQKVRFIHDPHKRIEEDRLRILRFFRFSAYYGGGDLDPLGLRACDQRQGGLASLSKERIWQEFQKILIAPFAVKIMEQMVSIGLLKQILSASVDLAFFTHMIRSEEQFNLSPSPIRRLAALCLATGGTSKTLKRELRLSNQDMGQLKALEAWVIDKGERAAPYVREPQVLLAMYGRAEALDRFLFALAANPAIPLDKESQLFIKALETQPVPMFPLKGEDLLTLGFTPGKAMGDELQRVKRIWLEDGAKYNKADLLTKVRSPSETS